MYNEHVGTFDNDKTYQINNQANRQEIQKAVFHNDKLSAKELQKMHVKNFSQYGCRIDNSRPCSLAKS